MRSDSAMTRSILGAATAVLALAMAISCGDGDGGTPTEIIVEIDAEPGVREAAESLTVVVEGSDGIEELTGRVERLSESVKPIEFPKRVAIVPLQGDAERAFVLTATAFDGDRALVAEARIATGYVPGEVRYAKLLLEDACIGVRSCDELQSCSDARCVDARVDARRLSDDTDAPTDVGPLFGSGAGDGGTDLDGGLGDAGTGGDAATSDAAVPDVGVVATAGDPCATEDARACSGRGSKAPLFCNEGRWQNAEPCDDDERCDAVDGPDLGTCKKIVDECMGQTANETFCAGDAMRICPDLVSFEDHACGENETCEEASGDVVCTCLPGFEENSGACTDIDECEADNGGCDEAAVCTNQPGTFGCACPSGYTGDGETCEPALISLELLGGALAPAFGETVLDYAVDLPIAVSELGIVPIAAAGVTVEVDGTEVTSGNTWTTPTLPFDSSTEVVVRVSRAGHASRDYTLTITRGIQQAYIKGSNTEAGDGLGVALALSADGNTLAVGTTSEDSNGTGVDSDTQSDNSTGGSGAVYVFTRSGSTWIQEAYIKASNTGGVDWFGESVALSADGNTLAVGADNEGSNGTGVNGPQQGDNSLSGAGAVYVFRRASGTWSQEAYVKASNTGQYDAFGFSVALSGDGDTLAVGAYAEESNGTSPFDNSAPYAGAAYVYVRTGGSMWTPQAYLKASDAATNYQFGLALTLSGDGNLLVVGANQRATYTGAAYVFERSGSAWTERQIVTASNGEAQDNFGCAVQLSSSGSMLAVAARGEAGPTNAQAGAGAVYVYTLSGTLFGDEQIIRASNAESSDGFGRRAVLSAAGDVLAVAAGAEDGSGTGIHSAPAADNAAAGSGAVYVYTRSGTSWTEQAYVKASNAETADAFGQNGLALSGDGTTLAAAAQNEDASGTGVNAPIQSDNSASNSGAVYVFR